jgi:tRNA threonylcarbamoyladenosine biosynthesis protein TsaB
MLLLSADTSGKHGSIALARCHENGSCQSIEVVPLLGGTFSAQLVPQIASLLSKHGLSKKDIGGFAVATGPGSFTGLRVGLAAIKALAEVLVKPIAAVSLLEAVAAAAFRSGQVVAVMDAGRGEMFAGRYEVLSHSNPRVIGEELVRIDDFPHTDEQRVVSPDERLADLLRGKGIDVDVVEWPRSDAVARLGWRKIQAGDTILPEQLEANYIRRSDAEISLNRSEIC